jgi:hypothetical protein
MPAPYPATIEVERAVRDQALVGFRGNFYSLPPGHAGELVVVRHRLGSGIVEVSTGGGVGLAPHRREPDGAGALIRADEHVAALERAVLAALTDRGPCRHKTRRPPSPAALAEAERIRRAGAGLAGQQVVVDFAAYAAGTRPLRPLDADADDAAADSEEAESW